MTLGIIHLFRIRTLGQNSASVIKQFKLLFCGGGNYTSENFSSFQLYNHHNMLDGKLKNYLKKWGSLPIALEDRSVFQNGTWVGLCVLSRLFTTCIVNSLSKNQLKKPEKNCFRYNIKYPDLEGIHKHHQVQLLPLHRRASRFAPGAWDHCPKASWTLACLVLWSHPWGACSNRPNVGIQKELLKKKSVLKNSFHIVPFMK